MNEHWHAYRAHRIIGGFGRLRSAWFTWRYRNEQLPAKWRRGSNQDDAPASDPFSGEPGTSSAAGGSWGNSNQDTKP